MKLKLRETLSVGSVGRVDRDTNTIHDVKVLGFKSLNGRRYSPQAAKNAVPLYENARVFFNHPEGESNARRFGDRFGRLVNVREAADGLVANLKYNPKHPEAESFLWYAENDPAQLGLSHNAEGRGVREQSGDVLVEEITKVHSVDIVDGPATTLSLYEQDTSMNPVTDPANGDGAGDIDGKIADLAKEIAAHPEWDKATKLAKFKSLLAILEDDDADKGDAGKGDDDADTPEPEMMEQLGKFKSRAVRTARKILAREQARKTAAAKGLPAEAITEVFLEQLAAAPAGRVEKLIEDRRVIVVAAGAEKPKSGGSAKPLTPAEIAASVDWN